MVRKRQRANQQASGSRSPQRSPTVQSRRADARGILEAEEGGEEGDFAHVFLAQGRQPGPRGRRSQAPFDRHPDTARSPEPERRITNRSQSRSSSFESSAGKGLKSLFFFLKERLFLPLDLAACESKSLAQLRRLLRESQRRARGRGKESEKKVKKKVSENLALWQQRAWEPGSHPGKGLLCLFPAKPQGSGASRAPACCLPC